MLILVLAACGKDEAAFPDGGGGEYTGGCELEGYEPVADTSAPMEGFTFSVDDLTEAMLGSWEGDLAIVDASDSDDAELVFATPGEIQAWYYADGSADGGDCAPAYMVELAVTLDYDGDELDEETFAAVQIVAETLDGVSFEGSIDTASLAGTASPNTFDPSDYEEAWLSISATFADGGWSGTLDWGAMTEETGDTGDTGGGDDTDGGDDTGEKSDKAEASESYATFAFSR